MLRRATQRLAARAGTRQVEAVVRADRASNAVARCQALAVADIRRAIEAHDAAAVGRILRALPGQLRALLRRHLADTLLWGHSSARHQIAREVPARALRLELTRRRAGHDRVAHRRGTGSRLGGRRGPAQEARRSLREGVDGGLAWEDLFAPWRAEQPDDAAIPLEQLLALLFPAPTREYAERIVHAGDWEDRIRAGGGLADPSAVAHRVAVGLAMGRTPAQITRDILPAVSMVASSARRLARTETMRVAAQVQMDAHAGLGDLVVGYQVHATLDERTRPEHRARDGTIYYAEPRAGQLGYGQMPRPPMEADGTPAWNCLLPGSIVQGCFVAASKARYSGQAVEVLTASGLTLRVTPNHPILTSQGFVAAQRLKKGDYVVRHIDRIDGAADHKYNAPAAIEEVFGSLQNLPGVVTFRPAIFDFHGDEVGVDGDVEIVFAYSLLAGHGDAASGQRVGDSILAGTDGDESLLPSLRTGFPSPERIGLPSPGLIGECHLPLPTGGVSHLRPLHRLCFGLAAEIDASIYEDADKTERLSSGITNPASGDTEFARKLIDRHPGFVTLDNVVDVWQFDFSGHVYDLQGKGGWIVADGIFQHNCRCYLVPVLAEPSADEPASRVTPGPPPDQLVYSDWFARTSERKRRLAVGTRRYDAVRTLTGEDAPGWEHFVDLDTGKLLGLDALRNESDKLRGERVVRARSVLAARRAAKADVVGRGYTR